MQVAQYMPSHRLGGHFHMTFQRSSKACLSNARVQLVHSAATRIHGHGEKNKELSKTYNIYDQMIFAAARVYQDHVQKSTKAPMRQSIALRPGTKSYKVFEKVVNICTQNKWLFGEFIAAQFLMMGRRFPLLSNLSTPGAIHRYKKFSKMFNGKRSFDFVAPSEKITIERAATSSCKNLVTIMLSRNSSKLNDEDLSFCDRYTLAFLSLIGKLPASQLQQGVAEEIDNAKLSSDRTTLLVAECKRAASGQINKLISKPNPYAPAVDKLKNEVAQVLRSLYCIE